MSDIGTALRRVREEIAAAAERAGRDPREVRLVAVSKMVSPARMREAMAAGQRDFGENRVQEAVAKYREIGSEVHWHFVGRLQRNKVRFLTEFVDLIHSVDRMELVAEIERKTSGLMEVLVEVNTSGEAAKGGVSADRLPSLIEVFSSLGHVTVTGLATMAPVVASPEDARPYFRRLAALREEARQRFPQFDIRHLSMGMSQDYVVAVEEGATLVRIGEAIFGPRPRPGVRGVAPRPQVGARYRTELHTPEAANPRSRISRRDAGPRPWRLP
ncbi:MAG: YggS family pyridoxal phosphate-dependent enzyme [Actinomycetota bacterium]